MKVPDWLSYAGRSARSAILSGDSLDHAAVPIFPSVTISCEPKQSGRIAVEILLFQLRKAFPCLEHSALWE